MPRPAPARAAPGEARLLGELVTPGESPAPFEDEAPALRSAQTPQCNSASICSLNESLHVTFQEDKQRRFQVLCHDTLGNCRSLLKKSCCAKLATMQKSAKISHSLLPMWTAPRWRYRWGEWTCPAKQSQSHFTYHAIGEAIPGTMRKPLRLQTHVMVLGKLISSPACFRLSIPLFDCVILMR